MGKAFYHGLCNRIYCLRLIIHAEERFPQSYAPGVTAISFCLLYLQLSYADITFFDFFNNFHAKGKEDVPGELEKFPLLVEHYKRVLNVPEINEWVKKRPVSEF